MAAVMIGAGVVAVASDSVRSEANQVQASDYAEPPDDLELAIGGDAFMADCDDAAFDRETVGPMTLTDGGVLDVEEGAYQVNQQENYCLRNTGDQPLTVQLDFTNVVSSETGCSPAEAAAELAAWGEEGCGAVGELAELLRVRMHPWGGVCTGAAPLVDTSFAELATTPRTFFVLWPGEVCVLAFELSWLDAEQDRILAPTDGLDWDVRFTGQPAWNPPPDQLGESPPAEP